MKMSKKILISLGLIVVLALILLLIITSLKNNKNDKTSNNKKETFFENNSFTERENIIKNILAEKFSISSENSSVIIARETPGFINGVFLSDKLVDKNQNKVYFYAITSNNDVEIVWYGEGDPDCQIMTKYNFPKEMSGNCQ